MAFKVAQNSLFAVLSRSTWWYSVLIGLLFIALSLAIADGQYVILGIACALPFFGIAGYAGRRQLQLPSKNRVLEVAEQARKMRPAQIADKIADNFRELRYDTTVFKGSEADLVIIRGNRTYLLSCKRFKAANTGIEPLKKLVAAGVSEEATGYLYVTLGEISDAASSYAKQNDIEIIQAVQLAAHFDGTVQLE